MDRLACRTAYLVLLVALAVLATLATTSGAAASTRAQIAWGAYVGTDSPGALDKFEQSLGAHVAIASSFRGWGDVFPDAVQQEQAAAGHTLLVAWDLGDTAATRFSTFYNGDHDGYLAEEASAAKNFGATIYVRPWAEMNADWVPFQPTASGEKTAGGTYAQFIRAWRYLVTFFRSHGAGNVRWVFNPTTDTYAETTPVNRIWPGAGYVDVLGLDGYNWGTGGVLQWRSFADIYRTQYRRLVTLAPSLPVWVCEFGSKAANESDGAVRDPRHSKSAWLSGMFSWLSGADHVRALVMFNVRKERDWRIQSSQAALRTMRLQVHSAATRVATA
jgi:mannan endo-1,4-beta-mannosidase